jgi:hypothetical protein
MLQLKGLQQGIGGHHRLLIWRGGIALSIHIDIIVYYLQDHKQPANTASDDPERLL